MMVYTFTSYTHAVDWVQAFFLEIKALTIIMISLIVELNSFFLSHAKNHTFSHYDYAKTTCTLCLITSIFPRIYS